MDSLRSLLAHPLTRGLSVDDPRVTEHRRRIVEAKPFLKRIYLDWYADILAHLPAVEGPVLELGSGPGFLSKLVPDLITSEVFPCKGVQVVADARRLPFPAASLRAIVMTDVLHHIPNPEAFLEETQRTLRPGGRLVVIEPWITPWSKVIYRSLHSEPVDTKTASWSFPPTGPLSGANTAMPWLIFERDYQRFERLFPHLQLLAVRPMMPFRYLVSGGVSLRTLMPSWSYNAWASVERLLEPLMPKLAMFALIAVERRAPAGEVQSAPATSSENSW